MLRAVYSERQLQEVLTDFWFNHFNVDARKGRARDSSHGVRARGHPAARARQVPRSAGSDREESGDALLSRQLHERRSEWPNVKAALDGLPGPPDGPRARGHSACRCSGRRSRRTTRGAGMNENYGRELMELHTLGVDGGYTQKDVTEVARAFTGWTIGGPRQPGGRFLVRRRVHDEREKVVLGHASRRAAASRTASRCSTSWRRTRPRRASSPPSWRGASSATRRRGARRPAGGAVHATRTATCAR